MSGYTAGFRKVGQKTSEELAEIVGPSVDL
jgi:hypothetical protein